MRVGIVKPDYQIVGGFERVLGHVRAEFERRGHRVNTVPIDVRWPPARPYGVRLTSEAWARMPHFFRYMGLVEQFSRLDLSDFDMVVSTQPPSFAARHPRQLSLFFHHERMFYDLEDAYIEAGWVDAGLHRHAAQQVRAVDAPRLAAVRHFLAGGEEVRCRLQRFNDVGERTSLFHAGLVIETASVKKSSQGEGGYALCVSRHEFPKRTELFVSAMKQAGEIRGVVVGTGGRLEYVRRLDALLSDPANVHAREDRALWMNTGDPAQLPVAPARTASNVEILGHVSDAHLDRLYAEALCLVAPAFLEDYGLTALEGMAHGKPVIVCEDGGHLAHLVQDGVTGLVVPPSSAAIGAAIKRLGDDPDLARQLGAQGRERARAFTWERAGEQLWGAVEAVMA